MATLIAALIPAAASATPSASDWFALADLRHPDGRATLLVAEGDAAPPARDLRYLRLSGSGAARIECCLRPLAGQTGHTGQADKTAAPSAEGMAAAEQLAADGSGSALRPYPARVRPAPREGAIALALGSRSASVKRLSPQQLIVRWPHKLQTLRITHCLSTEGLHVWLAHAAEPVRHLYLHLGMEVAANCPAELLAAGTPAAAASAPK